MTRIVRSSFRPLGWLKNPHQQTLWAALCRQVTSPDLKRQRLELNDGDFIDVDYSPDQGGEVIVLIHGLSGSAKSNYMRGMMTMLSSAGYTVAAMHLRSCSGEMNRLQRFYCAGDSADFAYVLTEIKKQYPNRRISAMGFSLGANILLKFLGETGNHSTLNSAIAISPPFDLYLSTQRITLGFSKLYEWNLVRNLKSTVATKLQSRPLPFTSEKLLEQKSLVDFDSLVTAPLHGYKDVYDYYRRCSCKQFLSSITTPTLILHALDDPFIMARSVPRARDIATSTRFELSRSGGHVGFISHDNAPFPTYWLEERVRTFLSKGY